MICGTVAQKINSLEPCRPAAITKPKPQGSLKVIFAPFFFFFCADLSCDPICDSDP